MVQADGCADLGQNRAVADVAAIAEVSLEESLHHIVLMSQLGGIADQAMRIDRVGRAGDRVEVEGDILLLADAADAAIDR